MALDFSEPLAPARMRALLEGIDVAVNAVGIFRERASQTFEAVHTEGPRQLFRACIDAGVSRVVQVSALGADHEAASAFHRTKRAADDALLALPLCGVVALPSLVYGEGGASARLFDTLAILPVLWLPNGGTQRVQPIHVDDACEALVALIEGRQVGRVALVGPHAIPLADFIRVLGRRIGGVEPRIAAVPRPLLRAATRLAGARIAWLHAESLAMLERGNCASSDEVTRLLGRTPRAYEDFIDRTAVPARRAAIALGCAEPLLRLSIAFVWVLSGVVSLGLYPVEESLSMLAQCGVPEGLRWPALVASSLLDILLGVLTLRSRHPNLWIAQAILILAYTAILTLFIPALWLHPFGPLSKNLPMLAGIALLYLHDRARWTT